MAVADESARSAARYWNVPLVRAAVALVTGVVITFSPDHTPAYGLGVFGVFAAVSGAIGIAMHLRRPVAERARGPLLASATVDVVAGAAGLALLAAPALGAFVVLVGAWGVSSGAFEFVAARRAPSAPSARDWRNVGAATVLVGVLFFILPPHPVVSVGLIGAYTVMLGVYLGIAAFSLKWAGSDTPVQIPKDGGTR